MIWPTAYRKLRRAKPAHWPLMVVLAVCVVLAGSVAGASPTPLPARAATSGPITYQYDANGRLATMTDPAAGRVASYAYDTNGNILSVKTQSISQLPPRAASPTPKTVAPRITGVTPDVINPGDTVTSPGRALTRGPRAMTSQSARSSQPC
jgi:YD repeat-containing protein